MENTGAIVTMRRRMYQYLQLQLSDRVFNVYKTRYVPGSARNQGQVNDPNLGCVTLIAWLIGRARFSLPVFLI